MADSDDITGKSPLQSKKFVAYLVAEATWKFILGAVLLVGIKEGAIDIFVGSIALAIVIIAGAIEALYIGGQAGLDKYTRIAQIAANAGQGFSMKGVEVVAPEPSADPEPTEPEPTEPEPSERDDG